MKVWWFQVKSGPHKGEWAVVYYDDEAETNVPFGDYDETKVLGYFPTQEEAETWIREGEAFERHESSPPSPSIPPSPSTPPPLPAVTGKPIDYAGYLNPAPTEKTAFATFAPMTEQEKHPRRADYDSYVDYAAAVYDKFGAAGSMGAVDAVTPYRKALSLGCALLNGAWPGCLVSDLVKPVWLTNPTRCVGLPDVVVNPEGADVFWVALWVLFTMWGWFGYVGIGILGTMGGWKGLFCNILTWIDWVLVIWPCIIFTVVALIARWRVSWPIFLVNLWMFTYIVGWILKVIASVTGLALVFHMLMELGKSQSSK